MSLADFHPTPKNIQQDAVDAGRQPKFYNLSEDVDLVADGPFPETGACPRYILVTTAGTIVGKDEFDNDFDSTESIPVGWFPVRMASLTDESTAHVVVAW